MKKKIRMTLSLLLAVLLIFGALPITAYAAETSGTCGISGSTVNWEYSNGTLTITSSETGGGTMKDYTASTDPPWIHLSNDITKITVKGVKKIGNYAFYGLSNLTTVEFPDDTDEHGNVTSKNILQNIGTYEFSFCTSLTELTFPEQLDGIGQHAFKESGITKLTFTGSALSSAGSGTRQAFRSHSGMKIYVPEGFKLAGETASLDKYGKSPFYKNYVGFTNGTATVYWKDSDGSILKSESVDAGTVPKYGDADEMPTGSDGVSIFKEWEPAVETVEANTIYVYTATYVLPKYTVTWANYDGTVLKTDEEVVYGSTPSYTGETPVKHNDKPETYYAFDGWSYERDSDDLVEIEDEEVTNDITYFAHFTETDKDPVSYVNAKGEPQPQLTGYEKLTDDLPTYELNANDVDWLIVVGEVTVNEHIKMNGDFNLLLCDGATLTVPRGISLKDNSSLTIWRQEDGTGSLVIDGSQVDEKNAGIGNVNWHNNVKITINGGVLDVKGGQDGAGIGGAANGTAEVEINGGEITATGADFGAGIGGGSSSSAPVTINGGTITAKGGNDGGTGIGAGDYSSKAGNVTINGGTVTATGGHTGAGIGGGENGAGAVTITGGTVIATGGKCGAGIGSGYFERTDGYNNRSTTVTITGGEVTATGGDTDTSVYGDFYKKAGAGIGSGGKDQNIVSVSISGGTVVASSGTHDSSTNNPAQGSNGVGIGSCYSADVCDITLTWDNNSKDSMSVTSDSYKGTVILERKFKLEDGSHTVLEAQTLEDNSVIAGVKITPASASDWQVLQYMLEADELDTITLDKDYTATGSDAILTVPSGRTVTLNLNGHTIDRNCNTMFGAFKNVIKNEGNLTISGDGVITGGKADHYGGGAVYNSGTLTITGGTFENNSAYNGGAITNAVNATLTISGGTFTDNTAFKKYNGGGGAILNQGTMTMTGGTITGNSVTDTGQNGGGIDNQGTLTITGGTITDNDSKTGNGGGIYYKESSTLYISGDPVIKDNTANDQDNDLYIDGNQRGKRVKVNAALSENAKIGLRGESGANGDVLTSGLGSNGTIKSFFSNYSDRSIFSTDNGEAKYGTAYKIDVTSNGSGTTTIDADNNMAASGDSVTVTATPSSDNTYVASIKYRTIYSEQVLYTGSSDRLGEEISESFDMPAAKVFLTVTYTEVPMPYVDLNGAEQEVDDYTLVKSDTESMSDGWYVVKSDITNENRISVSGDVDLILCDGAKLTATKGIQVQWNASAHLTIWQQSAGTGELYATSVDGSYNAAIGSNSKYTCGKITINGGNITAVGTKYAAGIGSGNRYPTQTITINAGTVTATGGYHAAGIGGGTQALSTVVINGGTVNATGGESGAGIGAGYNNSYLTGKTLSVTINGGEVTANGGKYASAIGCGQNTTYASGFVTVNGGRITANAGSDGGYGISTMDANGKEGAVTLNWTSDTKSDMSVNASSYNGTVKLENYFRDEYETVYEPIEEADKDTLVGKTLTPYEGLGAHLVGHSISLDGDIAVNFYMELSDSVVNSNNDPYMLFNIPDTSKEYKEQKVYLKTKEGEQRTVAEEVVDPTTDKTYYMFKCRVAAKDMKSEITAQMFDGDSKGGIYRYSVKQYADYLMDNAYTDDTHATVNNQSYADAYDLVKAMLTYGDNAEYYFEKTGDEPARITDSIPAEYDVCEEYTMPDGVSFTGATLSLKSQTTLSLYFTSNHNINLTCDGQVVDKKNAGNEYVIRIRNIAAADLNDSVTVKVDDANAVTYSPLTYCYKAQNSSDSKLANTVKALYQYWVEANKYFSSGGN